MNNFFSEDMHSMFIVIQVLGVLSFFSPRVLSVFPIEMGYIGSYEIHNKWKAFSYSIINSVGLVSTLLLLSIFTALLPGISMWLYLCLSILLMREGMQMTGIVKLSSIFSTIPSNKNELRKALYTGILAGFLSFHILIRICNVVISYISTSKLIGILLIAGCAIGQSVLLMSLETLITIAQSDQFHSDISKYSKLVKVIPGMIFIFLGFVISYFGFSFSI